MENIKYDRKNYRKHSERNKNLIKRSLSECGAGRSILLDKNNEIIAGNGIFEQAEALNIPVKIIETNGNELVAVKRTDLDYEDEKRRQLAVLDNATSDTSEFDIELLKEDFSEAELEAMEINPINDIQEALDEIERDKDYEESGRITSDRNLTMEKYRYEVRYKKLVFNLTVEEGKFFEKLVNEYVDENRVLEGFFAKLFDMTEEEFSQISDEEDDDEENLDDESIKIEG